MYLQTKIWLENYVLEKNLICQFFFGDTCGEQRDLFMDGCEKYMAWTMPHFLMMSWQTLFRCIAISPPAHRLWLHTWFSSNPYLLRCSSLMAVLMAVFIDLAKIMGSFACDEEKYDPIMVCGILVWSLICLINVTDDRFYWASWWV